MAHEDNIDTKALPSQPVWYSTTLDLGYFGANSQQFVELMAVYQKNSTVHACIDINAKAICASDACLYRTTNSPSLPKKQKARLKKESRLLNRKAMDDTELEDASKHPYWVALNNRANDLSFSDLNRLVVISLQTLGIAFVQKERNALGQVVSYRYLPAYNITPQRGEDGRILGWFYNNSYGDTLKIPITKDDMLVFRWPSPVDPHGSGDSPLLSAIRKVELSGKWLDFQDWLIGNRARPEGVFIPKTPDGASLSPEQAHRAEKSINDKFRGPGNGRWAISELQGQWVPLTFSPTDLAPLAFEEELKKALLFVLGIPEGFSNNDGNRANLEASLEQWARQSLAPIVAVLEDVWTREAQIWDKNLVILFENVIPEDEEFELEEMKVNLQAWQIALQYGGIENDDYRKEVLGLDPRPATAEPTAAEAEEEGPAVAPEEENAPVSEPEQPEGKGIDLLSLNKAVVLKEIDRATAISLLAFANKIPEEQARKLVTHAKYEGDKDKTAEKETDQD